jgi:hypothetical protein
MGTKLTTGKDTKEVAISLGLLTIAKPRDLPPSRFKYPFRTN